MEWSQKFLKSEISLDTGTRAHPESSITICIVERELACFVHLCYQPLHWALFIRPRQCSHIFVAFSAFRVRFIGDLKKNIVRSRRSSNTFARALLGPILQSSSCPFQWRIFFTYNSYQIDFFTKQWIHIDHLIWLPIQLTVPTRE